MKMKMILDSNSLSTTTLDSMLGVSWGDGSKYSLIYPFYNSFIYISTSDFKVRRTESSNILFKVKIFNKFLIKIYFVMFLM